MKKNNTPNVWQGWRIISYVLLAVLLVAEGLLFFQIWNLKMLPMKYFIPILVAVLLIDVPLVIAMFPRTGKWQKPEGNKKKVIAYVLSVIIAAGCLLGWRAVVKGEQTVDAITREPVVTSQVGVYVMATDPAAKLEDTKNYTFAYTEFRDAENTKQAVEGIEKILGKKITLKKYENFNDLAQALYTGQAKAMILNVAYAGLYDDNDQFSDFREKTKQIYTYDVKKVEKPTTVPSSAAATKPTVKPKSVKETPFIMYLSGSDTRSSTLTDSVSRSDVNILAVVHPETKQILLVNTPRDYYIENPAYGVMDKLTHCGLDGMENSMEALSNLYGYSIDYNAQINFTGFETLIDAIGGVNIVSDYDDGVFLSEGDNYMDGELALKFARERYSYADGDNARGRHQMQVITAVVEKMSSGSMITNYNDIMDSLQGMFTTSIPSDTLRELIKMQLDDMASWNVKSYAVTGYGGMDSTIAGVASVMYPNEESVEQASKLIKMVLDGKQLSDKDVQPLDSNG